MKYVKKFEKFVSEKLVMNQPAPTKREVLPGITEKPGTMPATPTPIKKDRTSPVPAPAKMVKATAMEVAERFIELVNQSGDDIKKYAEIK
jgi:hypothetical protein